MNLFRYDSPVIRFLSKMADMIILNVITLIVSIPVVTIGAATTALHYAVEKTLTDEGTLLKNYFHAFATNFKQATIYWLLILLLSGCSIVALLFMEANSFSGVTRILCFGSLICCCLLYVWVFVLQATFENTTWAMLRNAMICALSWPVKSILMGVLNLIPLIILIEIDGGLFLNLTPLWLAGWFSGCACLCRWLLLAPMKQLKENVLNAEAEAALDTTAANGEGAEE